MPVDWEARYETGDTPWDKGAAHPALTDFLRDEPQALRGRVLVPGCGYGHDVRAIAEARTRGRGSGECVVVGIDIAPGALRRAAAFQNVAGETYALADLFALPPSLHGAFDWVWEHTCFCAIHPQMRTRYVEAVAGALKPAGHLLAVFYLDPDMDAREEGPPFGVAVTELDRLFDAHFQLLREWPPARTYEGREGREFMRLLQKKSGTEPGSVQPVVGGQIPVCQRMSAGISSTA